MPLFNYLLFYRDGIALKKTEAKENEENKKGQVSHFGNFLVDKWDVNPTTTLFRVSLTWPPSWLEESRSSSPTQTMVLQTRSMTPTIGVRSCLKNFEVVNFAH